MFQGRTAKLRTRKAVAIAAAIAVGGTLLVGALSVGTASAATAKKGCLTKAEAGTHYAYYQTEAGGVGIYCDQPMIDASKKAYPNLGGPVGIAAIGKGGQKVGTATSTITSAAVAAPAAGKGPNGEEIMKVASTSVTESLDCDDPQFKINGVQYLRGVFGADAKRLYPCSAQQITDAKADKELVAKKATPAAAPAPVPAAVQTAPKALEVGSSPASWTAPSNLIEAYAKVAFDAAPATTNRPGGPGSYLNCPNGYQDGPAVQTCVKVDWGTWLRGADNGNVETAKRLAYDTYPKSSGTPKNGNCQRPYVPTLGMVNTCALVPYEQFK